MDEYHLFPENFYCTICGTICQPGEIVSHFQRQHQYPEDLTAEQLYDRLMRVGAIVSVRQEETLEGTTLGYDYWSDESNFY